MKSTVFTAILAFGIGVYVGKPSQVVVKTEGLRDCTVIQTIYKDTPKANVSPQRVAVAPRPQVADNPKEGTPDTSPSPQDDNTANGKIIQAIDEDEQPISDGKKWAHEQISGIAWMTAAHPQEVHTFTFTQSEYAHIDELRAEIAAQRLSILEEAAAGVGKYVWVMKIVGPQYVVPTS